MLWREKSKMPRVRGAWLVVPARHWVRIVAIALCVTSSSMITS